MRFCLAIAFTTLLLTGCSGEGFPEAFPVTGTVMYQGKPVEGATVTLVPSDPKGRSASGITDAQGKFAVTTYFTSEHRPDGALSGKYVITVTNLQTPDLPEDLTPQEEMAAFKKLGPPKNTLPKIYASPKTSSLKVQVDDAAPEPLVLELKG